jgi:hypothetical protein
MRMANLQFKIHLYGFRVHQDLQLMGALEALNEMLRFGRTTAFLFVVIDRTWASTRPLRVDATIHRMCVVNS